MTVEKRIFNFSAGPAVLPLPVLEKARDELLSWHGTGMSVMEFSHRSLHFESILEAAEKGIRRLLTVPENYRILFLQGGASLQFSMVPMNLLGHQDTADYVITGAWGTKAAREARRCGNVNIIYSDEANGFRAVPKVGELNFSRDASYIHYTSNETIHGVEFKYDLDAFGIPVVCDASSNILSKPIDIEKYALVYAGAQKNLGPSGVTVVIVRDDILERVAVNQHSMLDLRALARNSSMLNTPNTWGIYLIGLVCEWLDAEGGAAMMQRRNEEKSALLYDAIDSSDGYYTGHAERDARSVMNVTFRLRTNELNDKFCDEATVAGMDGLKGHRTIGGIRASIYNAFPREGVEGLVDFMREFARVNE